MASFQPEQLLADILTNDASEPSLTSEADCLALAKAAEHHGLEALIVHRIGRSGLACWPQAVRDRLARRAAATAAIDALQQCELEQVLEALAEAGVSPILLKGTPLAYSIYERSSLRPRFDTDILIRRQDVNRVAQVMAGRGYVRPRQVTGDLVMHQIDFARRDHGGAWHVYDFHWKVANRQVFANVLSFDELNRDALDVEPLGRHARTVSHVHALLLACVHRVAHHHREERLIWLYDIHLLVERLTTAELRAFFALAADRAVSAVCHDGLSAAQKWFRTRIPENRAESRPVRSLSRVVEPSETFLGGRAGPIAGLLSDLKALPDWSERLRLVYEHAFPSADYMTDKYFVSSKAWLPALYTHRIVRGAWSWLRRSPL